MHAMVEMVARTSGYDVTESMEVLWGFRESGAGFIVAETSNEVVVASVPLMGLALSQALVDQLGDTNQRLPLGGAFLVKGGDGHNCCWTSFMQKSWLDAGGDGVVRMLVDTIGNAAGMTNRIAGELAPFGGERVNINQDSFSMMVGLIALQ